jgi:hypothetical protein
MRVFLVMVPNPRFRDDGPEHWDGRIHYVWPFKLHLRIAIIVTFAIGPDIPLKQKQNKAAKE